jgi:hypothetical protein
VNVVTNLWLCKFGQLSKYCVVNNVAAPYRYSWCLSGDSKWETIESHINNIAHAVKNLPDVG